MNASFMLPKSFLIALRPDEVSSFLTGRGWASQPFGALGQGLQFRSSSVPGVDLLLPLGRDLDDYEQRMADLVAALAIIEQRPIWETINDLEPGRSVVPERRDWVKLRRAPGGIKRRDDRHADGEHEDRHADPDREGEDRARELDLHVAVDHRADPRVAR
jgi:hypothetical protein